MLLALLPGAVSAHKAADSLYAIAEHHFRIGDFDKMLEYAIRGLKLAENGTCSDRVLGHLKVGRAYYHLQQRETALRYLQQTAGIAGQCGLDSFRCVCYRQIGGVYLELGKKDSSLLSLQAAERMLVNTTRWGELSSLYAIMGTLYHDNARGKQYYDLAEKYAILSGDTVSLAFAITKKGIYALNTKDCKSAEHYFRKGLALYTSVNLVEGRMYALNLLSNALSDCGRAGETYELMKDLQAIRDSIFKKETAENIARYRTLYETEKKDRENAQLELQLAHQARNKRMLLAGFAITILLLVIAFLYLYSRYKLKKQKEADRQMAEQQALSFAAVIEAEEKERKRIASDLHDGVGQTMSAARINLSLLQREMEFDNPDQKDTFEKALALVDESCREVRSVSHSMMPNALLKSGLATAIRNFLNQIDSKVLGVDFYTEGLDASLNTNNEVVLYRVIQECVNNVIKHAGASRLYIALIRDEEGISVTIEDNGKGFDSSRADDFEGIGLKNIRSRVGYLKGTVEWDSAPGRGTAVTIHVPA